MEAGRVIATILQDWYYIGNKRVNGKVIGIRGYSIVEGNTRQCSSELPWIRDMSNKLLVIRL